MTVMVNRSLFLDAETGWKALRYFNLYRLFVSALFLLLTIYGDLPSPLGVVAPRLFKAVAVLYFVVAMGAHAMVVTRAVRFQLQVFGQVLLDVCVMTLMIFASGGISSGIGMLLVVTIAGSSILAVGRMVGLFAAIASLMVLIEEAYSDHAGWFDANYMHAGLLGAVFFMTAVVGTKLANRIRKSEAIAAQREVDLANVTALNEHIIQRMQSGILVLDANRMIRLMNESAAKLLGSPAGADNRNLAAVAPAVAERLTAWERGEGSATNFLMLDHGEVDIQVSFTQLEPKRARWILIFVEDAAKMRQQAQQLKLASLGRLTASIAHEIRNPLGAISHAGQLLNESSNLIEEDRRLTSIIKDHSERLNAIIENVLNIGRRSGAMPESFEVESWLEGFVKELRQRKQLAGGQIALEIASERVQVRMDKSQLRQVLWNLCENGLRYSRGRVLLKLRCGIKEGSQRPFLDVIDSGPGIDKTAEEQIFEPFFTFNSTGTGLGLYIASELCEANQAKLILFSNSTEGCCFRITFAHPGRWQPVG